MPHIHKTAGDSAGRLGCFLQPKPTRRLQFRPTELPLDDEGVIGSVGVPLIPDMLLLLAVGGASLKLPRLQHSCRQAFAASACSFLLLHADVSLAADLPALQPSIANAAVPEGAVAAAPAPTAGESGNVRGSINGAPAEMVSAAEAAKLREEAAKLPQLQPPPNSDLARMLNGEVGPAGSVSSPRAHGS